MSDDKDKKPAKKAKEPKAPKEEKFKTRYAGTLTVGGRVVAETPKYYKNEKSAQKAALALAVEQKVIGTKEVKVRTKTVEEKVA